MEHSTQMEASRK
ncbi:hypothetical protein IEO21_10635 [Rhodonia placenta]|uniref:Uncharacterized protein n=1 Tax=Rhodonia placenta TaxID=104341 RepID=A0A8H7NS42_9APHY|nr:hypothetical protein IEO21_10635 [Postia placenta]